MSWASKGVAQPTLSRKARLGFLSNSGLSTQRPYQEAFLRGLRELGWLDGVNIEFEYRFADGQLTRLPELARELVASRVDVIVTAGPLAIQASQQASRTVPIVVAIMPDPVALGVAHSFAKPGGNVTGLANLFEDLTPKQLQLLKEAIPRVNRVALLVDPNMAPAILSATEAAAGRLGLHTWLLSISEGSALDAAIESAKANRADGLHVLPSPLFNRFRAQIAALALRHGLPSISEAAEYVRDGGLMSYGPDFAAMYYRAASYVDRVLKGARPADLPIEQPTRFELVINLVTARRLAITIPQSLRMLANEVIK